MEDKRRVGTRWTVLSRVMICYSQGKGPGQRGSRAVVREEGDRRCIPVSGDDTRALEQPGASVRNPGEYGQWKGRRNG